mmetsp:Transcript_70230/g.227378  ORF Transcript_70230/g.227378 Transcript_70230/m.227378 type:complete len:324 (+) Transcript_70230:794-1765(+)
MAKSLVDEVARQQSSHEVHETECPRTVAVTGHEHLCQVCRGRHAVGNETLLKLLEGQRAVAVGVHRAEHVPRSEQLPLVVRQVRHREQRDFLQPRRLAEAPELPHQVPVKLEGDVKRRAQVVVAEAQNEGVRQGLGGSYPPRRLVLQHPAQQLARLCRSAPLLQRRAALQAPLHMASLLEAHLLPLVVLRQEHQPSEQNVEKHSEAPYVGRGAVLTVQHHLWRHVMRSANNLNELILGEKTQEASGKAKVDQFDSPVAPCEHEILCIQISVDKAVGMTTEHCLQALPENDRDLLLWHEARAASGFHAVNDVSEHVWTCAELCD